MRRLLCLSSAAWFADESDLAVTAFRQSYAMLRPHGSLGMAVMCIPALASAMIDTGRWADADRLLDDASAVAVVHRFRYLATDIAALRAELRALRTPPGTVHRDGPAPDAWTAIDLDENRATHTRLLRAAGIAALASGDADAAFRHLRALFAADGTPLHYFLSARSIADLAAAARSADECDAAAAVTAVRRDQGQDPTPRMRLQLHHAEALVKESREDSTSHTDVERSYRLAVIDPAGEQWPLERAQARLHYAQWLRRRRRPLEARPLLAAAHDTFTRLGALRLADLARAELRATGATSTPPGGTADPLAELTSQQREIVQLAARGLRNREIAEQLFLSPRTVGSHLHNAYPKLGISGRHQLRDILGDR
jgi:DNA-binding CsgD family transcriptional regulator